MTMTRLPKSEFVTVGNIIVGKEYSLIIGRELRTHYTAYELSSVDGQSGMLGKSAEPGTHVHTGFHRSIDGYGGHYYAPVARRTRDSFDREAAIAEAYEAILSAFPEATDGRRDEGDIVIGKMVAA